MNKEPLALYLFRLFLLLGVFALLGLLYWSSNLLEHQMKQINQKMDQIGAIVKTQTTSSERPEIVLPRKISSISEISALHNRPHVDPKLPNLLQEDPFYSETLPKILGKDFQPSGIFQNNQLGRPVNLNPFSGWAYISAWNSQCTVTLAKLKFGIFETFAPDMAIKIEERVNEKTQEVEFWVHLRDNVFWSPLEQQFFSEKMTLAPHFFEKHPVTAEDFKFYFDVLMNSYVQESGAVALRNYFSDIQEIQVLDPLTLVVRWKNLEVSQKDGGIFYKPKYVAKQLTGGLRPLPRWVYQYFPDGSKIIEEDTPYDTYRTNSVWAQNFNQHWAKNIIVSCGPWLFDGMTDREIRLKRNPNHYFPLEALALGSETYFKDTQEAIWEDFKAGKIDTYELRPDELLELDRFLKSEQYQKQVAKGLKINRLDYVARVYAYIGWNEARPFFSSNKVRQAMTMAINRHRIIEHNLNGMGIEIATPFYPYSPSYDQSIKPWPFDLHQAKLLLEEEGWYDSDNDGIIDKEIDGKRVPFKFSLTYFVKNPTSKSICEYVATALKEIGISCQLNGLDITDIHRCF